MRQGDWFCGQCTAFNYQSNEDCIRCGVPIMSLGSTIVSASDAEQAATWQPRVSDEDVRRHFGQREEGGGGSGAPRRGREAPPSTRYGDRDDRGDYRNPRHRASAPNRSSSSGGGSAYGRGTSRQPVRRASEREVRYDFSDEDDEDNYSGEEPATSPPAAARQFAKGDRQSGLPPRLQQRNHERRQAAHSGPASRMVDSDEEAERLEFQERRGGRRPFDTRRAAPARDRFDPRQRGPVASSRYRGSQDDYDESEGDDGFASQRSWRSAEPGRASPRDSFRPRQERQAASRYQDPRDESEGEGENAFSSQLGRRYADRTSGARQGSRPYGREHSAGGGFDGFERLGPRDLLGPRSDARGYRRHEVVDSSSEAAGAPQPRQRRRARLFADDYEPRDDQPADAPAVGSRIRDLRNRAISKTRPVPAGRPEAKRPGSGGSSSSWSSKDSQGGADSGSQAASAGGWLGDEAAAGFDEVDGALKRMAKQAGQPS